MANAPDPQAVPPSPNIALPVDLQWEIHPKHVHDAIKKDGLILDVRTPGEWQTARIADAKLIPLAELVSRIAELEPWRNKPIVVHCHHGIRSMRATQWLRAAGFSNVKSMAAGIDGWSVLVDPAVPRY